MSPFCFVDRVAELKKDESLTSFFTLKGSEEFLKDHFSDFPVMPGVLLLEALVQSATLLLAGSENLKGIFFRLVAAEEVKFGQFVKPGSDLRMSIRLLKNEGVFCFFEGRIDLVDGFEGKPARKALTANFKLAPVE